jgi:TolB-like protein
VDQASHDQFGLKVKLTGGNVANRVLPIRIYDLENSDIKLCESVLGGVMRGVEFIYKETGVNRPLRSNEDNPHDNLNRTIYRNQINKVANAAKEIITAIGQPIQQKEEVSKVVFKPIPVSQKSIKTKIIVASGIILSLIVLGYFLIPTLSKPKGQLEKSIAVLPFINDSPNDSTTYFMDGIMEEVLNNLQSIKDLRVLSRNSVEQYRNNATKSTPEIAKALGVNYIVEGSGQKYGNSFRLRVQLIKAAKEGHLWGKSYEKEIKDVKDIFSIQSEIAQAIANQLEAVITPQEKQFIQKTPTANLEAYNAYLKGEYYRKRFTKNDLETAMKYYKIALEKDPEYAQSYCGIAWVWFTRLGMGYLSSSEGLPKQYDALMTAQKLDSTLAEVHYELAVYKFAEWDFKGSESEFQKALRINPNYTEAKRMYSEFLSLSGRQEEAMGQIELALKLDPYDPAVKGTYAIILFHEHRYNEAIVVSREALKIDSTNSTALSALMFSLHLTKRYDEALEPWKKNYYESYPSLVHAFDQGYAKSGYRGALRLEADTLVSQSKTSFVSPNDLAFLYVCSGNKERALDYLERGFKLHQFYFINPIYDSLRNEPRFQALCRKLNLPVKYN